MARIVLMQQAFAREDALLRAVAEAAARMQAELEGLFVEDSDLFNLAGMPYASEVCFPSATRRGMDVASLERSLQHLAERARRDLENVARQMALSTSFRVARGSPLGEMLAAASDTDIVVAGTLSGNRAPEISLICTSAVEPERVARLLMDLAPKTRGHIVVALREATRDAAQEWEALLCDALEGSGVARRMQLAAPADERELASLFRARNLG